MLEDSLEHRLAGHVGAATIALDEPGDVVREMLPKWVVEVKLRPQTADGGRVQWIADQEQHRTAGSAENTGEL